MAYDVSKIGKGISAPGENSANIVKKTEADAAGVFEKLIDAASRNIAGADKAAVSANTGGPVDLHDVMIAMEKADITLRLLVQVRNKAVDAYKEIMRMQV
jgi:flagellar hook-basal body complex protein FliE